MTAATAAEAQPAAPPVTVSAPVQRQVTEYSEFTGQFAGSAVVEIRPRVGGYLTEQLFTDGQMVNRGDRLFTIDPRPYEIALQKAMAPGPPQPRRSLNSPAATSPAATRSAARISLPPVCRTSGCSR